MAELNDFGEKIGGARKDVWQGRGLSTSDLLEMSDVERESFVKKENVWPKPDWVKEVEAGKSQALAFWQNEMRKAIPPLPPGKSKVDQDRYVKVVGTLRDAVMAIQDPYEIDLFYKQFLTPTFISTRSGYYVSITAEADGIVNNKVLKAAQAHYSVMASKAAKSMFGIPKDRQVYEATKQQYRVHQYDDSRVKLRDYTFDTRKLQISINGCEYYYADEKSPFRDPKKWQAGTYFVLDTKKRVPAKINFSSQKEAEEYVEKAARALQTAANRKDGAGKTTGTKKGRKTAFVPPQLESCKRTGPEYRDGKSVDPELFQKDLKFRGGEFGNWLNENDRQASLDMAYDALRDLSRLLNIRPEDVSLNGSLAIAFGARGRGGLGAASAHYEPGRQVINLTKMTGAGALAHEWGHALDHAIGISCGMTGLASEGNVKERKNLPEAFTDLLDSLEYKMVSREATAVKAQTQANYDKAVYNLTRWIDSAKPDTNLKEINEEWESCKQELLKDLKSFRGVEYQRVPKCGDILTNGYVERLSCLRKVLTGHGLPKENKIQIALWAKDAGDLEKRLNGLGPTMVQVHTDYYLGSKAFDGEFTKMGHGYWSSKCEMFARAFDCYIADKLKESGVRSDYLSGRADSYVGKDKNGKRISAIPEGEERKAICEKFDRLFEVIKERGLLNNYVEAVKPQEKRGEENPNPNRPSRLAASPSIPNKPQYTVQLSFEDLLFNAASRAGSHEGRDSHKFDRGGR